MRFFIFLVVALSSVRALATASDAYRIIRPMLVQIKTSTDSRLSKHSYGTGFVVDKNGLLVTNYHVVADSIWRPKRYRIQAEIEGKLYPLKIKGVDFVNDLALLEVDFKFDRQITFASNSPDKGELIYSLGLPADVDWTVVTGVYNGLVNQGPYELIHMSSPLNPGMSGGPTVNGRNQLIAVNVSGLRESQQISFGVPAKYVNDLIRDCKRKREVTSADLLAQFKIQVTALQEKMTHEIIEGFTSPKLVDGRRMPSFAKGVRCWSGGGSNVLDPKYNYQGEVCQVDQSIPIANEQITGMYSIAMDLSKNEKLNNLGWLSLKGIGWNYNPGMVLIYDKSSLINFASPTCYRERIVVAGGQTRILSLCLQQMNPVNELYDGYINIHIPLNKKSFLNLDFTLGGFSKENIKEIVSAAVNHSYEEHVYED